MNELMEKLKDIAQTKKIETVENQTDMSPVCFLIKDNEIAGLVILSFNDEKEKRGAFKTCGSICAEKNFDGAAIVVDALFCRGNKDDPDIGRSLPSELPESLREEALIINYTDFRNLRNNKFLMMPYEVKGNKISFSTSNDDDISIAQGQLEGCLIVGFMTAKVRELIKTGLDTDEIGKVIFQEYLQGIDERPGIQESISKGFF